MLLLLGSQSYAQSVDKPIYMGKAATGESVWYYGGRAQCGDLPSKHKCWNNPMIVYMLGNEKFNTVLDYKKKIFAEAFSVPSGKTYKNVIPTSAATKKW